MVEELSSQTRVRPYSWKVTGVGVMAGDGSQISSELHFEPNYSSGEEAVEPFDVCSQDSDSLPEPSEFHSLFQ